MIYTKLFTELNKNSVAMAGGKGASLGEMTAAGLPVPPGFVILADTFERFLEITDINIEIDALLGRVNHKEVHTLEQASSEIQALILNAEMPIEIGDEIVKEFKKLNTDYVAVRSSATAEDSSAAAWAGQLDSFLNTTVDNLLFNVRRCWASLFTPRAIFYRFEKELHQQKISVAVVVQKMIEAEVSGVAFSVHPVTEDRNQVIIEAGFGLGEAIVSGQITPDSYVITKNPRQIIDKNIYTQTRGIYRQVGNQGNEWRMISDEQGGLPCLSDQEILELTDLVIKIEHHYGFPCDIEWARAADSFYIVQSRPITTLQDVNYRDEKIADPEGLVGLDKIFSREKSLMYMMMWDISERMGYKKFINYDLKNSLFIFDHQTKKTSVWYDAQEASMITKLLADKVNNDSEFVNSVIKCLDDNWELIFPFLSGTQNIETIDVFRKYYQGITAWWSAMNTVYPLINIPNISVEAGKTFLRYREYSERYTGEMDALILKFWNEKLNQKYSNLVQFLLLDEAVLILEDNISDQQLENIAERVNGFFIYQENIYQINKLNYVMEKNRFHLNQIAEVGAEEFMGISAYPGLARGLVKKIINKSDIYDLKEGEILVAETTYPDHVAAMKKAIAFITDEGGITCHAAIVAREMKKPCIIGTKIATQVLHNGDEIEADANQGVVRIIKKADQPSVINIFDYQKLFQINHLPYFINDVLNGNYQELQALFFQINDVWMSFLPKKVLVETLAAGLELYADQSKFTKFKNDFTDYKQQSAVFFDRIVLQKEVNKNEIEDFFQYVVRLHYFYIKTEFFYTDQAFLSSEDNEVIKKNLKELEEIKNSSREYLNKIFFGPTSYIGQVFEILARQFKVDASDLLYYSRQEILRLFLGQYLETDEKRRREKAYLTKSDGAKTEEFSGELAVKLINPLLADYRQSSDKLKGVVANKGVVTGLARVIVYGYKDFDKIEDFIKAMESGEVLVADTTSPELIIACHKASAILTNQGGLMSHAAIVSRELKIPCIVGLGNATEKIKTGDLLEVNADTGEVVIKKG